METLKIKCAEITGDSLRVRDERADHGLATLHISNTLGDGSEADHSLNEETARQLFNWLGIWLHKGGS